MRVISTPSGERTSLPFTAATTAASPLFGESPVASATRTTDPLEAPARDVVCDVVPDSPRDGVDAARRAARGALARRRAGIGSRRALWLCAFGVTVRRGAFRVD